ADGPRVCHRLAHGFYPGISCDHQPFSYSAVVAFGRAVSSFGGIRLAAGNHALESAHLWSAGIARSDVGGEPGRVLTDSFDVDSSAFFFVHVWTGVSDGKPPQHQAGGVMQVPPQFAIFPVINATLNGASAV